jgi:hypothetical protein
MNCTLAFKTSGVLREAAAFFPTLPLKKKIAANYSADGGRSHAIEFINRKFKGGNAANPIPHSAVKIGRWRTVNNGRKPHFWPIFASFVSGML